MQVFAPTLSPMFGAVCVGTYPPFASCLFFPRKLVVISRSVRALYVSGAEAGAALGGVAVGAAGVDAETEAVDVPKGVDPLPALHAPRTNKQATPRRVSTDLSITMETSSAPRVGTCTPVKHTSCPR